MPTKKDLISQLERACDGIEAYRDTANWSGADDEFLEETRAMICEAEVETLPTSGGENVVEDVVKERLRQITRLGHTPEKDDTYQNGELERAASCMAAGSPLITEQRATSIVWPWRIVFWKENLGYRQRLVQAAALLLAAIERWDREEKRNAS